MASESVMWFGLGVARSSALAFADRKNLGVPQAKWSIRCHTSSFMSTRDLNDNGVPGAMLVLPAHVMPFACDKAFTTYPRSLSITPVPHTRVFDESDCAVKSAETFRVHNATCVADRVSWAQIRCVASPS
jgi:hypothetical protein